MQVRIRSVTTVAVTLVLASMILVLGMFIESQTSIVSHTLFAKRRLSEIQVNKDGSLESYTIASRPFDSAEFRHGPYLAQKNGHTLTTGLYVDNRKHGLWLTYERDRVAEMHIYQNGQLLGPSRTFFESGAWEESQNGADGKIMYELSFRGQGDAPWTEKVRSGKGFVRRAYYPDGKVEQLWVLDAEGKQDGRFLSWWPNGHLASEGTIGEGSSEGYVIRWRENGTKESRITYHGAKKHGPAVYWNEDGDVSETKHFIDDVEQ